MTGIQAVLHKGYEIETDADGHITVWAPEHCERWTETSVDAAKARIDFLVDPLPAPFAAFVR